MTGTLPSMKLFIGMPIYVRRAVLRYLRVTLESRKARRFQSSYLAVTQLFTRRGPGLRGGSGRETSNHGDNKTIKLVATRTRRKLLSLYFGDWAHDIYPIDRSVMTEEVVDSVLGRLYIAIQKRQIITVNNPFAFKTIVIAMLRLSGATAAD